MNQPKSNIFLNIVYFLIAFLIIFLVSFIIYENFIKIKNPVVNEQSTSTALTETQIDTLGKDKFTWMNSALKKSNNYPVFFTNNSLDVNNFDNNDALTIAYDALTNDDKNETGTTDSSCFKDATGESTTLSNYPTNCYKESFDKSLLTEQINKTFTSNLHINYIDFTPSGSKACSINGANYTCFLNMSGIDIASLLIITGYDHSEYVNNNLIVYSKLLTVKRELDIYPKDIQGIYSDLDGNNKIDDLTYYDNVTSDGLSLESKASLITKYKDSITTYKSTYTKSNAGDYVWVSTEKE